MAARTIAVIEDEITIAQAVAARLKTEGYAVEVATDGPGGVELCTRLKPDLVVLDVMLPGFDGIEVCRRIQQDRHIPVLMLTARDTETDLLVGLGIGADDYMTKPFSMRELVARIQAILRRVERAARPPAEAIRVGELTVDPGARRVSRGDSEVHLTPIEFELLHVMAVRPGMVFTRERLLADIWGYEDGTGARTVDSHIAALRRKLGSEVVRTVHGVGYSVEP
ncbi:MAG: response regulator transcription factor [Actinomycetota bacterium]